jgi:hypothetical protein
MRTLLEPQALSVTQQLVTQYQVKPPFIGGLRTTNNTGLQRDLSALPLTVIMNMWPITMMRQMQCRQQLMPCRYFLTEVLGQLQMSTDALSRSIAQERNSQGLT